MKTGARRSPEACARIAAATRAAMADPAVRERISRNTRAAMADPAVRKRISVRTREGRQRAAGRAAELAMLHHAWRPVLTCGANF